MSQKENKKISDLKGDARNHLYGSHVTSSRQYSYEFVDSLINTLPGMVVVTDSDFNILFLNKHLVSTIGDLEKDILGKPVFEVLFAERPDFVPAATGDTDIIVLPNLELKEGKGRVHVSVSSLILPADRYYLLKIELQKTDESALKHFSHDDLNVVLSLFIEAFSHPLYLLDLKSGKVIASNGAAAEFERALRKEDDSGKSFFKALSGILNETLSGIKTSDSDAKRECEFENREGEKVFYETFGYNLRLSGTGAAYAIQCFMDITEQKKTIKELKTFQENRELLLRNIPGIAFRCKNDSNWTMLYISSGCKKLLGYEIGELTGENQINFNSLIVSDDVERVWYDVQKGLKQHNYYSIDYHIITKSGRVRWVQERGRGIYNKAGELIEIEGLITDITGLKSSEEKLVRVLAVNQRIAEAGLEFLRGKLTMPEIAHNIQTYLKKFTRSEISYLLTRDQRSENYKIYCSRGNEGISEPLPVSAERLKNSIFGQFVDLSEAAIKNDFDYVGDLPCIPHQEVTIKRLMCVPSVVDKHAFAMIFLVNGERPYNSELIVTVQRFVNLFALAMFRIQTEITLREAKLKAEESDRLKSIFLSNMSHDMRTPMNAIMGFAELLQDSGLGRGEKERYLDAILKSGDSLLHLVNDIVDISKIEAGELQLNYAECKVNSLLDEMELAFRQELDRRNKSHVMLYVQKGIPDEDFSIYCDSLRVKQIVSNLLSNAVKFTDDGFIEIGYRIEGGKLLFYVRDSGIGIAMEDQKLVFERFGRVKETADRNLGGTGLGLAITKNLVEIMGGKIWLDSFPDEGSTFWFTLPLRKPQESQDPQLALSQKPNRPDLSDSHILIVEDVDTNYFYLSSLLEKLNARVVRAVNGQRAVDICKSDPSINLVLMDIELPVLNGYEATREIKKIRPGLPVIAQTAYVLPGEKERCMEAGCDEYLAKPIRKNELIETIQRYAAEI